MRNKRKAFIIMIMGLTLSVSLLGCNSKGNVSVDNEGLEEPTEELIEEPTEEPTEELIEEPTEEPIDDDEDTKDEDTKNDFNLIQFSAKIVGEKSLQVILSDKASDEDRFVESLAHLYRDGEMVARQKSEGDTLEFEIPIVEGDIIHVVVNNDLGWSGLSSREGTNDASFVVGADSQLEEISYTTQTTFVSSTDDAIPFSIVVDNPYTIRINAEDDRADKALVKVRRGDEYLVLGWATPQEKAFHDKTSLFVFTEGLLEGDVVEVTVNSGLDFENYGTAVIKAFNYDLPIENPEDNKDDEG